MDFETTLSTFENAAKSVGIDPSVLPGVEGLPEGHGKALVATYKLFVLSQAAWRLEGQEIDWNNDDQYKHYPWFDLENYDENRVGSASGFSFYDYFCARSSSHVGSRLVFPSAEIARYVGVQHIDLYRDLMVLE